MAWVVLSHGKLAVAYFALLVGAIGVVLAIATGRIPLLLNRELGK